MKLQTEKIMQNVFLYCAMVSIFAVLLICGFLLANGLPGILKIGLWEFLGGSKWKPSDMPPQFGILPMILGSLYVTVGAVVIGVPVGVFTAVFMAKSCPKPLYKILKPAVNLLAGIPSIVYGFFGLGVITPVFGHSIFSAALLLGIMILPTVIALSESAIAAVPPSYYEGGRALGANHNQAVFFAVLPGAKHGIFAAAVLGIGRAVGETMAVIMVAGNQARIPSSVFGGARTLTANIVLEMGYAALLHREALIATGVVLMSFILLLNLALSALKEGR